MKYISVSEFARKYNLSERTVRNYCALGKIKGAFITGKTWNIPEDSLPPQKNKSNKKEKQQVFKTHTVPFSFVHKDRIIVDPTFSVLDQYHFFKEKISTHIRNQQFLI